MNSTNNAAAQAASLTDLEFGLSNDFVNGHKPKKHKARGDAGLMLEVVKNQVSSIFFILLLVSAALSYSLGQYVDSTIFMVINLANVILGFSQEYKASKASQLLQNFIKHTATVLREGKLVVVDSEDVVVGDIVALSPGDVLVADIMAREFEDAYIDESLRTGESAPIEVSQDQTLYAGSSVVAGKITGQVIAASDTNSLVKYANTLGGVKKNNSFAKFISSVSMNILYITLISLGLIAIFSVWLNHTYTISEFVLFSISMLVGVVPESLPLIITLMLTREALALAKDDVLVKRLSSLQQLGSIKYLLTDKTGTLTENSIRIVQCVDRGSLVHDISLISQAEYERTPMDKSLDESILNKFPVDKAVAESESPLKLRFTPFKNKTGYATYSFSSANSTQEIIRGQYNAVIALCFGLSEDEKADLDAKYAHCESQGLRVIACASRTTGSMPGSADSAPAAPAGANFTLSGMLAFEDPLKPDAVHSYKAAEGLGISVKVLTGDSQMVALYIAQKLDSHLGPEQVCSVDTTSIKSLSDADLNSDKVYARCQPEEKLELIDRHLQKGGVGFLGEGINDALALKRADVGMVVYNASDVARQSADILLMEKSLNPVIKAIQMSRRVYAHISTYLLCTLTGNIGTLFSLTAVALFWNELPMLPVQILLNNLLTDVPLILLITDHLAKEDYSKPIEHSSRSFFKIIAVFGLLSTVFDMGYFFIFKDYPLESLRTGWFVFSILCELILVLSLRTNRIAWRGSRMSSSLALALGSCALFAIASPYIPFASLFELVPLSFGQISFTVGFAVVYFLANEILKLKFKTGSAGPSSAPAEPSKSVPLASPGLAK